MNTTLFWGFLKISIWNLTFFEIIVLTLVFWGFCKISKIEKHIETIINLVSVDFSMLKDFESTIITLWERKLLAWLTLLGFHKNELLPYILSSASMHVEFWGCNEH